MWTQPGVTIKHGAWYLRRRKQWIPLGRSEATARAKFREVVEAQPGTYLAAVYDRAKKNARHREIPFGLAIEEFWQIVKRAGGRCEVTGIWFSEEKVTGSKRRPWAPSLDRIDSSADYRIGNCRLVCVAVNAALSDWGEAVLSKIVARMRRRRGPDARFSSGTSTRTDATVRHRRV